MISYLQWKALLKNERLPAVVVDLDAFDRNVAKAVRLVRESKCPGAPKTLRLATKSLRVPELLERALKLAAGTFQGLMCFSAEEIQYLRSRGLDDFLLAYPTLQKGDLAILRAVHDAGTQVTMVVDHPQQVARLAEAMEGTQLPFRVLLDIDVSLRFWSGLIHLGVRRSGLRTVADSLALCEQISRYPQLLVTGLMAYEAQVAGLGDRNPFKRFINPIAGLIRKISLSRVAKLRADIAQAMRLKGYLTSLVNGAGTGSLNFALKEESLTEVTIGSGLLCSHLFDYYSNIQFEPAAFFALQAVRTSDPGYITCLGGGYIASGEPGWDRLPLPYLPAGLKLVATEGCGEVQTPLRVPADLSIELGEPVIFRHAKAGELAERFHDYLLVSNGTVVARAQTYRGAGHCFF